MRINIISNGHFINDDLIYFRYGLSLKEKGALVKIFARDIEDKEKKKLDQINVYGVIPQKASRFSRFLTYSIILLFNSIIFPADVFIICSPSLFWVGIILKILGNKVIYNAQEYYPLKLKERKWVFGFCVPFFIKLERLFGNMMDGVIVTDHFSTKNYKNRNILLLPNFPTLENNNENLNVCISSNVKKKTFDMVYIGTISENRGLEIFIDLLNKLPDKYIIHLFGRFERESLKQKISSCNRIRFYGYINHNELMAILKTFDLGLCIFKDVPAYRYSSENTTKLFEYMKCGLPIIASDFPGLRKIIETTECGLVINPNDVNELANAIINITKNKEVLDKMRENSKKAYLNLYNWEKYKEKLWEYVTNVYNR